jgi:gas vesicle protein
MVNHNYEHENDAREPGGSWVGLLIGGLTGAVVMLLVAPQSGKKTRAKIHRQSYKLRKQTTETVNDAVASARDTARQVTHDVSDKVEELKRGG